MCLTLLMVGEISCQSTASSPGPSPAVSSLGRAERLCFSLSKWTCKQISVWPYGYTSLHICVCLSVPRATLPRGVPYSTQSCSGTRGCFTGIKLHRDRTFKGQICSPPEPACSEGFPGGRSPISRMQTAPGPGEKEMDVSVFLV